MAERAIKLDWTAAGLDLKHRLSREHQNILEDFVEMTRPFEEAFETLQRNGVPAICQVLPLIYGLRIFLQGMLDGDQFLILHGYAEELLKQLNVGFSSLENDDLFLAAAFLDPAIKFSFTHGAENPEAVKSRTQAIVLEMMRRVELTRPPPEFRSEEPKVKRSKLFSFMDKEPRSSVSSRRDYFGSQCRNGVSAVSGFQMG
ncbi:hypothetical protein RvY_00141 [Ramazzottius varieornatus]|uniref:Uncharacterized protein n=1 Tax=Ramazzottius varieornatus TaxID=947166 RepID=A0A1D1UCP6_RAMVA|nr:hypothetical protein RvY_00141 [Ramazzottius varieornatus]